MKKVEAFAKQTFLALKNPYDTVCRVYPGIIDRVGDFTEERKPWYIGVKNADGLEEHIKKVLDGSPFLLHTVDEMALGGRAVDLRLVNPLSGRWMSGSSSGTALNVFYGMNDAGIGTDGGGSVLAPAAALNLVAFISPLIEEEYQKNFLRTSTDRISFTPSIGLIGREMEPVKALIKHFLGEESIEKGYSSHVILAEQEKIDRFGDRQPLIEYLKKTVVPGTMVISDEGPIDLYGMGDSVFGHFDEGTKKLQAQSGKGLMRVVNMSGKTALVLPREGLGNCRLYICESRPEDIAAMLEKAEEESFLPSELASRYFGNLSMYL